MNRLLLFFYERGPTSTHQVRFLEKSFLQGAQGDLQVLLCLAYSGVIVRHVSNHGVVPDSGRQLNFMSAKVDPRVHLQTRAL